MVTQAYSKNKTCFMGHILHRYNWYSILRYGAFPITSSKKNFVGLIGISFRCLRKILKNLQATGII